MALSDKKIAFLLTSGVEQIELTSPRTALDEAEAEMVRGVPRRRDGFHGPAIARNPLAVD